VAVLVEHAGFTPTEMYPIGEEGRGDTTDCGFAGAQPALSFRLNGGRILVPSDTNGRNAQALEAIQPCR
jgi:hypothetical protein